MNLIFRIVTIYNLSAKSYYISLNQGSRIVLVQSMTVEYVVCDVVIYHLLTPKHIFRY